MKPHDETYTLRRAAAENSVMAWLIDKTTTISPIGRRVLLECKWETSVDELEKTYDATDIFHKALTEKAEIVEKICIQLMSLRDISATLNALQAAQVMGDIELYELKALALTAAEVRSLLQQAKIDVIAIPDTQSIINILDPEQTRIAHFYIYDAYSTKLKKARIALKAAQADEGKETAELFAACSDLENSIRQQLSSALQPFAYSLMQSLKALGELDVLIARARLVVKLNLARPDLRSGKISYYAMHNPQVSEALQQRCRTFQPVNIDIHPGATVITGANMAGKSVVLKTTAMCQRMAQFGFYVPAAKVETIPVDAVVESIGDAQSELDGMSSYAAEMLQIDFIIKEIRKGSTCLALIDEPARTTNPEEGKALVNAIIELLNNTISYSLITTHYGGLTAKCRRLRVHGFRQELVSESKLTATSVNDCIDYSLEPTSDTEAPQEALRIAKLLGVSIIITETAEKYIDRT